MTHLPNHAQHSLSAIERPSELLAAARAAGMSVIDYTLAVTTPTRARALMTKHRADCARRGMPFEPPLFAAKGDADPRLSEMQPRFVEDRT